MIQIGTPHLPEAGDPELFFDVESVPMEGLFYLMGLLVRRGKRMTFEYDLARQPEDEAAMWVSFLQRVDCIQGWVYHYGWYERTAVKTLMDRYGQDPRGQMLLDRMIDLQRVLRDSVVLPLRGYSLKDIAPWLGFEWSGETRHADDSILEYLRWLQTGRQKHLDHIVHYNEDDVRATVTVRDWLLTLPAT